jgi:hypothetical protein
LRSKIPCRDKEQNKWEWLPSSSPRSTQPEQKRKDGRNPPARRGFDRRPGGQMKLPSFEPKPKPHSLHGPDTTTALCSAFPPPEQNAGQHNVKMIAEGGFGKWKDTAASCDTHDCAACLPPCAALVDYWLTRLVRLTTTTSGKIFVPVENRNCPRGLPLSLQD